MRNYAQIVVDRCVATATVGNVNGENRAVGPPCLPCDMLKRLQVADTFLGDSSSQGTAPFSTRSNYGKMDTATNSHK